MPDRKITLEDLEADIDGYELMADGNLRRRTPTEREQRFQDRIEQENAPIPQTRQATRQELLNEIARLRRRIEELEGGLGSAIEQLKEV